MGRIIDTVGVMAKQPYTVPKVNVRIYTVEELCYVLSNHAFLLDGSIMDQDLANWLDDECHLPDLAKSLYTLIHQKGSPSALAGIILDYVGFGNTQQQKEVEELLRQSADMDPMTKMKNHGDFLVKKGHFTNAIQEYDVLLNRLDATNHRMTGQVQHNKGIALCKMFRWKQAASCFLRALEEDPNDKNAELHYLAALRFSMSEDEYTNFLADHRMWYESSLELESMIKQAEDAYEESEDRQRLLELWEAKEKGEPGLYYEMLEMRLSKMKEAYRKMVLKI